MLFLDSKKAHCFTDSLLQWFRRYGRVHLPWQRDRDPYKIWLSEIMLQQTRVEQVIPYFNRFLTRFADIKALAAASQDDVLSLWTGLGYYARARNLHRCATVLMKERAGIFPDDIAAMMALPGIGRSTAAAILSFWKRQPHPILDGNVKRVLTRFTAFHGWPGYKKNADQLWRLATQLTPVKKTAEYNQAIMDLGATVCAPRMPRCDFCPVKKGCAAKKMQRQHDFPTRRPKNKSLPLKQAALIIMENKRGAFYLQQRPPDGIWGGLWSFPECAPQTDIAQWIITHFGYQVIKITAGKRFRHCFSHFKLDIFPIHAKIDQTNRAAKETQAHCWYTVGGSRRLGLSAPVKRLLETPYLYRD